MNGNLKVFENYEVNWNHVIICGEIGNDMDEVADLSSIHAIREKSKREY